MELFLLCIVAGFGAQMIDGSLGMGYGVILSIILSSMGLPPIHVTASVHVAKFFATGASGLSHLKFGNVNKKTVQIFAAARHSGFHCRRLYAVFL